MDEENKTQQRTGWICPVCGVGIAMWRDVCPFCENRILNESKTTNTWGNWEDRQRTTFGRE